MRRALRLGLGVAGAIGYAAVALGSGLDRMSDDRPSASRLVPPFFRVNAARSLAASALERRQFDSAVAEARRAVAHDPVDARSSGMLGRAYYQSGKWGPAYNAFAFAGTLGWREPVTQIYWMENALQSGRLDIAADRLDALLRQAPAFPQRNLLLAQLEATPAGREQIARRLAARPDWIETYFRDAPSLELAALSARSEVADVLALKGGVRSCKLVSPLIRALFDNGRVDSAWEVWRDHCPAPGESPVPTDGGFERAQLTGPLTPFDWRFTDDGAIAVSLRRGLSGQAAMVSSSAPEEKVFASQMLRLRPGRYTVEWRALNANGAPSGAVGVNIACAGPERHPLDATLSDRIAGRYAAAFALDGQCPLQWLSLIAASGAQDVAVDDILVKKTN
jgi:hypothetical protein